MTGTLAVSVSFSFFRVRRNSHAAIRWIAWNTWNNVQIASRFKHNHWVHGLSMAFLHAVQGRGSPPYWFFCQPTELIKMWIFIVASSTTAAWRTIPTGGVTWIAGIAFLFLWGVTYRCLMDHPCWIYTLNHTYSTYIYILYIIYIYIFHICIYIYIYIIYIYILCMYTSSYCLSIGNPAAVVGPFMNPTSS